MSKFAEAKKLFEIDSSGGIEEDIQLSEDLGESSASLSSPNPPKSQAKTAVAHMVEEEKAKIAPVQPPPPDKLDMFKRLLRGQGRANFLSLCEKRDPHSLQYVIFEDFLGVLKSMGFRLRMDEAKQLLITLNVINEKRNIVFYYKVVSAVLRKLYLKDPYKPPAPLTQPIAVNVILAGLKRIKAAREAKKQLIAKAKTPPNPQEIVKSLARKLASGGPSLLDTFHKIDKDHSGFVELRELGVLFADYGVKLLPMEVKATFDLIDTGRKGKISYNDIRTIVDAAAIKPELPGARPDVLSQLTLSKEELERITRDFLSALQIGITAKQEPLLSTFQRFDPGYTQRLTFSQFEQVSNYLGVTETHFDLRQVFNFIDTNKSGTIEFSELENVIVSQPKPSASQVLLQTVKIQDKDIPKIPLDERLLEVQKKQEEIVRREEQKSEREKMIASLAPKPEEMKVPISAMDVIKTSPRVEPPPRSSMLDEIERKTKEKEAQEKKAREDTIRDKYRSELEEITETPVSLQVQTFEKPLLPTQSRQSMHKSKLSSEKEQTGRTSLFSMEKSGRTSKKSESTTKLKLSLEEKAAKAVAPPIKSALVINEQRKQLEALFKAEIVKPAIRQAVIYAESLSINKSIQKEYQSRPAVKDVFIRADEWERPVVNVLPRTLWAVGQIGRVGLIDHKAALLQFDLSTGQSFQPIHVGRRAPLREVPILAVACDPKAFRLYILDKQWILEVWEMHQYNSGPILKFPVLSKPVGQDYVDTEYTERNRDLYPTILLISDSQMVIVNATAADGCVYFFSPVSLTIEHKLRMNLSELETPASVLTALQQFANVLKQCESLGIPQSKAFQLMDKNGDGELSKDELESALKDLKVSVKAEDVKGMVQLMDIDGSGRVSLQEFREGLSLQMRLEEMKAVSEKANYVIPEWVNSLNANSTAREALYKLFQAFDQKGYDPVHLFSVFDSNNSGVITRVEFERMLIQMLSPLISQGEIELLGLLADKDNSGYINYVEFTSLLDRRNLTPVQADLLNSSLIARDSITYVQQRCLELSIDLLKLFQSEGGVLTKARLSRVLLELPLGLGPEDVRTICDRDVHFDPEGCFDYEEMFRGENYARLVKAAEAKLAPSGKSTVPQKPQHFTLLPESEKHAIAEDVAYIEDLQLLAFTSVKPKSSIVFLKHMGGKLLARLVGHVNKSPPIIMYVRSASCLVTGEKRSLHSSSTKTREKLCEILVWNLQGDLVERYQTNPPWVMRPSMRIPAHEENIIDLAYLPLSQLVVSSGADKTIKLWNPTGTPYSLTERHRLSLARERPGYYKKAEKQTTQSNRPMSLVETIRLGDATSFRFAVAVYGSAEWLLSLNLNPPKLSSEGKYIPGFVRVFGFDKLKLEIPVNKFDVPIPVEIMENLKNLNKRKRVMDHFRANLPEIIDLVQSQVKVQSSVYRDLKEHLRLGVLLESQKEIEVAYKTLGQLPMRKMFGVTKEITPGEVYRLLTRAGLLVKTSFAQFLKGLDECRRLHHTQALGMSTTYSHPGFSHVAHHIRNQELDLEPWLRKLDPKSTGTIDRKQLQKQILGLNYGLTESETNAMMEELDPYFTCKIEIRLVTDLFRSDILAAKLLGLSRPTELVNKLRSAIFPQHAKKLQYYLFEIADGKTVLSLSEFVRALNQSQVPADSDVVKSVFELLSENGQLSIPFFIRQVYSQHHSAALHDIDTVLLELKLRLLYQRLPLSHFFSDENGPLTVIAITEFISKAQTLGVDVTDEALVRTAKFLSTTLSKGEGIQLQHFMKHMQRLPESMSFVPKAGPPVEVIRRILEGKMKKDVNGLRTGLIKWADKGGVLTAAQMRSALNDYFQLEIASPVVDSILSDLLGVESLHFSQILSKLTMTMEPPTLPKLDNINLLLREAITIHANAARRPFEDVARQIFQTLKERDKAGKGWLPVGDFVNILRFNLPEMSKELQGQVFLLAEKDHINIETFAVEALRGVPGVLTASQAQAAQKKFDAVVDDAFFQITSAVRSSGVSLERAFALFDKDKDKVISVQEFQQALSILDLRLQRDHMEVLLEVFDKNHDGVISYTEFLQAINTHTSAKPTVDLDHWRVHFLKLPMSLCRKFQPKVELFTVKVLRTNPQEYLITFKVFREVMEQLSGFDVQEIEALGDFAIEGSKEQMTKDLLPSQMPKHQYAFSKLNELIHFSHFTEAFNHLMKTEPQQADAPDADPSEPDIQPVEKPSFTLTPEEKLEKELFEYLAKRMSDQKISLERLFLVIDKDGDGTVSKEELGLFMQAIGYRLTSSDLNALMKVIDENADDSLSYKELRVKLLKFGYVEPEDKDLYTHEWVDFALAKWVQLFNLQRETGFGTYEALFNRYDYNRDKVLSCPELRMAAHEIAAGKMTREEVEHVAQVLLIHSHGELSFDALTEALRLVERDLPKLKRLESQLDAVMFHQMVTQNSPFTLVRKTAEQLSETALSLRRKQQLKQVSRGLSLYGHQVFLDIAQHLLRQTSLRLTELLRVVCARCQLSILSEANLVLVNPQDLGQANVLEFPDVQKAFAVRLQSGDFRVIWDESLAFNYAIKLCNGVMLRSQTQVGVEVYSPEGLKHISSDGNTSEKHVAAMLQFHSYIQEQREEVVQCLGMFERRVGVDATEKEIFVFVEQRPGRTIQEAVSTNGGLLHIPVIQNTRSSLFLVKFWGRLVLDLLFALQSHSVMLRTLRPEALLLSPNGLNISLLSLKGMAFFDQNGQISEGPDIAEFLPAAEDPMDDPYLAPEYMLGRASELTSAVDVWSFGALLYELLTGRPPPSFLQSLQSWYGSRPMPSDLFSTKPAPRPSPSYCYAPFSDLEVYKGAIVPAYHPTINMVRCIQVRSYSGLIQSTDAVKESKLNFEDALEALLNTPDSDELQEAYERLATLQHTSMEKKNELGLMFDLIALCLQVDPAKRPTLKALIKSPFFQMDQYELLQAQRLAGSMIAFKSPELTVTQRITLPLKALLAKLTGKNENLDLFSHLVDQVEMCVCETAEAKAATQQLNSLLTLQAAEPEATSATLTPELKDALLQEALNSSNAALVKQIIHDKVLDMLVFAAFHWFHRGNEAPLERLVRLLSSVVFEYYTFASPASPYVDSFLDVLLKLFVGEDLHLASSPIAKENLPSTAYILRSSFWTPKLYLMVGPLYKDTISENGLGQHYYPVIRDYISNETRSADYFSELISLAENLYLLRVDSTGTAAKKNALKHVRSMLITRNGDKLKAALDLRLPQHLIHLLQDADHMVRLETIQIFQELSRGCVEPDDIRSSKALETHKFFSVLNFFGVAKNITKESTKDLVKYAFPKQEDTPALIEIAKAFESPAYMVPIIRLLKMQSEPYSNKEGLVICLLNVLRGTDGMIRATCSPATDSLATLCKSLVVHARNTDNRSAKMLTPILKEALEKALAQGRPNLLRAFENTPGAKALLRDQGLTIPKSVTLQQLMAEIPATPYTLDSATSDGVFALIRDSRCWLQYIYIQTAVPHEIAHTSMMQVFQALCSVCDFLWPIAILVAGPGVFVEYGEAQRSLAKAVITESVKLLHWMVTMNLEYLWINEDSLRWLCQGLTKCLQECLKADVFRVYPLTEESVLLQDILMTLLQREPAKKPLATLEFGRILSEQLCSQYDFVRKVMNSSTEFLQVIPFYARQCDLRLKAVESLLSTSHHQIQMQFLETQFVETLAKQRLTDHKSLDARFSKLNHPFLPFRECAPIRGEAIAMVQIILTRKRDSPEVYDDLILHLRRANTIQAELGNLKLYQHGSVVHATALQLLTVLVESADSQLEFLLIQEEAHRIIGEVFEKHPILAHRYSALRKYCEQFK